MNSETPGGYITDSKYPSTYFRELSPAWLNYVAALKGTKPRALDAPFAYLELGCGTARSAIVHASEFPGGVFHACDFNVDCMAVARKNAADSRVGNIELHEASFAELLDVELPAFDFIVAHGVYSWVGDEPRATMSQLIDRFIRPGGLVYLSYNCLPGWAHEAPLRKLMVELAAAATGDSTARAGQALQQLQQLSEAGLMYFRANPEAMRAVSAYGQSQEDYLTHEFFNDSWEPRYSVDVADEMGGIGLQLVGSATLVDNHPELLLEPATHSVIGQLPTSRQQELAVDFAVNRQFRRDVFVRLPVEQPADAGSLGDVLIGCPGDPARIREVVQVPRGRISFSAEFISELQELLRPGAVSLSELTRRLGGEARNNGEIARNLLYLIAAGELAPMAP